MINIECTTLGAVDLAEAQRREERRIKSALGIRAMPLGAPRYEPSDPQPARIGRGEP